MYRYYSLYRPVAPGTFPKDGVTNIHNYDERLYVAEIDHEAWGYLDYDRELTEKEIRDYELAASKYSRISSIS